MNSAHALDTAIEHTLTYFAQFHYAPTSYEVYLFLPIFALERHVDASLANGVKNGSISCLSFPNNIQRYTLPQYSISKQGVAKRLLHTNQKEKKVALFVSLLKIVPTVQMIGLSGSVASFNAASDDDIDLFIITTCHTMWSARLLAIAISYLLGTKRPRRTRFAPDKVCLNLWFETCALMVPSQKQNEYTAYEVWRMRPLFYKGTIYSEFLAANQWTAVHLPNLTQNSTAKFQFPQKSRKNTSLIERIARSIQLLIMKKHRTSELISQHQLWFFPDDVQSHILVNRTKSRNLKKKSN